MVLQPALGVLLRRFLVVLVRHTRFLLVFQAVEPLYHWEEREIPCPDVGCRCRDIRPFCFLLFRLIDCCLGIALYRFVMSGEGERLSEQMDKKAYGWQSLILVVLLAFCLAFFAYRDVLPVNFRGVSFFWPFAFLFIISLMVIERSRPRFFSLPLVKIFTFLGDISMEMFLTHEIVIYVLNVVVAHYGLCRVHPLVLYAFYIVAIILFAWLARLGLSRLLVKRVRI